MKSLKLLGLLALSALALSAQGVTVSLMPNTQQQFFDTNGKPLAGGSVYTYIAGTSTPQATYTNSTATVANANPVLLDASGFPQSGGIWLTSAAYKIVVKNSAGVTIRTVDNVQDIALAANPGFSVKAYGAKGDDVADDSAAIAAACTAANGIGTVVFPPATYKIITGNITTCKPGTAIIGNGSTIDLNGMAANTTAISINVGGFPGAQALTLIQDFNITGFAAPSSVVFLRADQTPNLTLRDINAFGVRTAYLGAGDTGAVLDHVTIMRAVGNSLEFSDATVTATVSNLTCTINDSSDPGATCLRIANGSVYLTSPFINSAPTAVSISDGSLVLTGGSINLSGTTGISISGGTAADVTVSGTSFIYPDPGNGGIAIDNQQTNTVLNLSGSFKNKTTTASATLLRTTQALALNMTGSTLFSYSGSTTATVFDLTAAAASLNGSITGNEFYVASAAQQINLVSASPAGKLSVVLMTANQFVNTRNLLNIGDAFITANHFVVTNGSFVPNFIFNSGNSAVFTNNFFTSTPTVGAVAAATCSGNINYVCP